MGTAHGWVVTPNDLEVGPVYVGQTARAVVTVRNEGRSPLELGLSAEAPFTVEPVLRLGGGESSEVTIGFEPTTAGDAVGTLVVQSASHAERVSLMGRARAIPDCGLSPSCKERRFDLQRAECVEADAPDGTACASTCLTQATCQRGVCTGAARSCDDGNACTEDSCDAERGCVNRDVSSTCPAARTACETAICRPASGCGFEAKVDGTRCGPNDCTTAHVCIAAVCEERTAPEGSECGEPGVCQAAATCRQNRCVPGAPRMLAERWSYHPSNARLVFEGTIDPDDGSSYFTESSLSAPSALQLVSLSRDGVERFRVDLESACVNCSAKLALDTASRIVFAGRRGTVQARSMVDGRLLWERDTTFGKTPRSPLPDGGGSWSTVSFISLSSGLVVEELSEGTELHRAYAIALSRSSGSLAWEKDFWGHLYFPVVTASEQLFVTGADCWAPVQQTVVFDETGATMGIVQRQAMPVAASQNEVLLNGSDVAWAGARGAGPPLPGVTQARWALTSPGLTLVRSSRGLQSFDEDGGVRWTVSTGASFAQTLLADAGVLLTETTNDGGSVLRRLGVGGAPVFTCPMPGVGGVGSVFDGLWIAPVTSNQQASLRAFEIGPAELASEGWVMPNGSPQNDRRPRHPPFVAH